MKYFRFTENSRLCSEHFIDRNGPTKVHNLPVRFGSKMFKITIILMLVLRIMYDTKTESQGRVDDHENEDDERVCESMATACGDAGSSASARDDTDYSNYSYIRGGDRLNDSLNFHSYCSQIAACNDSFTNKETQTPVCCLRDACTQTDAASSVTSTGTQTDAAYSSADVEIQTVRPCLTIEDIENDDSKILFYTGIPNRVVFHALFDEVKDCVSERERRPRFLRSIDEFFMVLMRLRLGLLLGDLADRFNVRLQHVVRSSTNGLII